MAADWEVEYQEERTTFTTGGRPVDVIEVHYVITSDPASQHRGSVVIEATRYNPDTVRALIEQKVALTKGVASL